MVRKRTHEEFIKLMQNIHPNIEVLGTYKGGHIKIKCRCTIDGHIWEAEPASLLSGRGCPICGEKQRIQKQTKTHEQFIEELQEINPDIEVLGTYVTNKTKIKVRCRLDGYEWETTPNHLLQGRGCHKCGRESTTQKNTKTHEQFMEKFYKKNKHSQDIDILGTYVNNHTKIKCKCRIDEHEWETRPNDLLRGQGCPICAGNIKKTHEQFLQELQQINPDIEILGTYVRNDIKIKCKCKICGHEWEATPNNLLRGSGCLKCNITKGEKRVAQYLDNLDIDYIYNKGYFKDLVGIGGGIMQPDFIIPSLKIWIEYDGIQHFKPVDFTSKMSEEQVQEQFKKVQQNDQIKNQYAEQHNWTLIRIAYWDYDNIEQILDAVIKQKEAI